MPAPVPTNCPKAGQTRRGWVGDDLEPDNQRWGSKLWLITDIPGKATETRRKNAERYAKQALQWMVTDGVARRVEANAWWVNGSGRIGVAYFDLWRH